MNDVSQSDQLSPPAASASEGDVSRKSPDQRKELLARTLQGQIASGRRIDSQSDYQAVLVKGKPVNHLLHFLIGLVTLTFWWFFVWIPMAIFGGEKRSIAQVDEFGNVSIQRL